MHSSMRYCDRTISYDTGLNLMQPPPSLKNPGDRPEESCDELGIVILPHNGSIAEIVPGNTHNNPRKNSRKTAVKKISTDSGITDQADDGIGTSDDETNSNSSSSKSEAESECANSPNMGQSRRVIKLDLAAMSTLLAFDEEEEEDLIESEEDEKNENKPNGVSTHNKAWRKTIAKDLAKLVNTKTSIRRRHSITLCESRHRKTSTDSTTSTSSNTSSKTEKSPNTLQNSQNRGPSPPKEFASLSIAAIENSVNIPSKECDYTPKPLKTLDLRLEEVAHIRSVLIKAELDAMQLDSSIRDSIARGKICFHCMKTKFGLFYRGIKCEMCKQNFCNKCHTKMRIPVEHFSTTPVFALSPMSNVESQSKRIELDQSLAANNNNNTISRKISLPSGLVHNASVGSAPNSPKNSPKSSQENLNGPPASLVPTISGMVTGSNPGQNSGPTSLPYFMLKSNNKYATLPTKTRRMSWISSREAQREKLEGSLLTVCVDCKEMVVQVIRVSRTSKRHSRAEFSSLSPDTVRDLRS